MISPRQWDQIETDLGFNDCNMRRDRPYNGQVHTDTGIRGATKIEGITFRDLHDAFIRAVCLASHHLNPALLRKPTRAKTPHCVKTICIRSI